MVVGPTLTVSLEPLGHCRNISTLSCFEMNYLSRCLSGLAELVPLPHSRVRSTRSFNRLHYFSVTVSRCYKDVCASSFFPYTAWFWHSLPAEYFPLNYDLNSFKFRIDKHLLSLGSF